MKKTVIDGGTLHLSEPDRSRCCEHITEKHMVYFEMDIF